MYPPPLGKDLTAEQARELDDTFLSSDPFEHFRSRIASLLAWHESAPRKKVEHAGAAGDSIRSEFNQYLQRPAADGPFKELDVRAQVAADGSLSATSRPRHCCGSPAHGLRPRR